MLCHLQVHRLQSPAWHIGWRHSRASRYPFRGGDLKRFEEAKALLRKTIPVALRVLGESDDTTFRMRWNYATSLLCDDVATLDDLREAVTTLEETEQTARRVLGGSHPVVAGIELSLRDSRDALRARESGKKVNIITRPAWAARRPSSKQSKLRSTSQLPAKSTVQKI